MCVCACVCVGTTTTASPQLDPSSDIKEIRGGDLPAPPSFLMKQRLFEQLKPPLHDGPQSRGGEGKARGYRGGGTHCEFFCMKKRENPICVTGCSDIANRSGSALHSSGGFWNSEGVIS